MVHVNIEALAGRALAASVRAHQAIANNNKNDDEDDDDDDKESVVAQVTASLSTIRSTLQDQIAVLSRMEERSDPYVYNLRVRIPMTGWTDERIDPQGMTYQGVVDESRATSTLDDSDDVTTNSSWRRERYFGETGAQSSYIPAIDAALGLSCVNVTRCQACTGARPVLARHA